MDRGYPLRNREPQPRAVLLPGTGFIHHKEGLLDPAELIGGNTAPVITNGDSVAAAFRNARDAYCLRTCLCTVVDKVSSVFIRSGSTATYAGLSVSSSAVPLPSSIGRAVAAASFITSSAGR